MGRRRTAPKEIPNVHISAIADKGRTVGRDPEGQVYFVEGAVPGDTVNLLVKRKKKGIYFGQVTELLEPSPFRETPFCQHYALCGGCQFQDLQYAEQLAQKEQVVKNAMQRIAKVEIGEFFPIKGAEITKLYRNKLEFTFSNKRYLLQEELNDPEISMYEDVVGFHRKGAFDKVINIEQCWLQPEPSNAIRNFARQLAIDQELEFFDAKTNKGYIRALMMRITTTGEVLTLFVFNNEDVKRRTAFLDAMLAEFPNITSCFYTINTKVNDYLGDLDMIHYAGKNHVEEQLGHVRFQIGPKSFFQTNTRQGERLYTITRDFAGLTGTENVYDLYTGIGSIGLFMAEKCQQVVGIEEIPEAIEDAKVNQKLNGIDNAVFYAGDVKDILTTEFAERHGKPDLVITDPPRAGMHKDVVQMLLDLDAPKIVYVSCNPGTQARDLALLDEKYRVEKMQPVDMFPHTYHIENVALLVRR